MSDQLKDLILSIVPEDGSTIGNQALLARLQDHIPGITEIAFQEARDELIESGALARGRGRGGSVHRANVDAFDLEYPKADEAAAKPKRNKPRSKRASKTKDEPAQVTAYRHTDTRSNNPEVGMVHAGTDPDGDRTEWQYDPHLDPTLNFDSVRASIEALIDGALESEDQDQMKDALLELKRLQAPYLNWTGKAEKTSFEVDTVSLHVHERVDPATILRAVKKKLEKGDSFADAAQLDLFAPVFDQKPLREALDFYHHDKGWSNRLVTGDSLLVMNSLLTKESMGGKVQMIYIDPPYGIKYGSNFQPFTNKRDVKDRSDADLTQEPEMIKAFRDTWELGIHSYLTYLRDRLMLARELLTESGSVFVQISDENVHLVRNLVSEIFGEENFVSQIGVQKTTGVMETSVGLNAGFDYILWYAKERKQIKFRKIYQERTEANASSFNKFMSASGDVFSARQLGDDVDRSDFRRFRFADLLKAGPGARYDFEAQGNKFNAGSKWWGTPKESMERLVRANRVRPSGKFVYFVTYEDDFDVQRFSNFWSDTTHLGDRYYVVQSGPKMIERCILMTTDPGDLVLDPTCGSGTTAFVSEKWGRRWITCDTSRVAITLAKQRLMTASFDYYTLRYPHEGLKGGFDYETVPHITMGRIANNSDIDTIYDEDHPKIAAALDDLNGALKFAPPQPIKPTQGYRKGKQVSFRDGDVLEEWEVPFDLPEDWPEAAKAPFEAFHEARQAMQLRMDQSIADHADQETLYDKPRIDKKKLRVAGPFSVEAVPAPTVLSLDDSTPSIEADESVARSGETSRQSVWRDELLRTGVRGKSGAMLEFAEFETLPDLKHIHATGSLTGTGERVVVSFGPEHAAMEQRQIELALTEAESLRPAPKFILFCAFTFDPEAAKDIDEINWPGVTLLKAQMNTDLLTEDLKKKRASNQSFWLMGQPDVELRKRSDDKWEVEVNGFDYFDPKAGDLVSGGKKQIAMWSIDTDYDERSMLPRQVFFPMADAKGGWNRLKNTVRSELDEDLLEQFHGTISLPFEAGDNKRVAVKIIDDRGIESLKILPLEG